MFNTNLFFIFYLFGAFSVHAQQRQEIQDIVKEGKALYRSEMASWYGTDIMLDKFKAKRDQLGGYFSYPDQDKYACVFFSKGDQPKILAKISFDDSYNVATASLDSTSRAFTKNELRIYEIRKLALNAISRDTTFKHYNNASLNVIPVLAGKNPKVYVLTGPKVDGVVIIGNDYLISFDNKNAISAITRLHKNIIPINYSTKEEGIITMHTHLPETGEYITPTDICTLMLYGKLANWKQHYVISAKQVSIWDVAKSDVVTLTREAWEKIAKDQKERHPDKQ